MTVTVRRPDGETDVFGNATAVTPVGAGWNIRHRDAEGRLLAKAYPAGAWLSLNCDAQAPVDPARYPSDAKVIGW